MRIRLSSTPLIGAALLLHAETGVSPALDPQTVFNLPRATHITVDGHLDDWADKGFFIEQLAPDQPNTASSDHMAWARLAWTRDELLLAARVWDDTPLEGDPSELAATASSSERDCILVSLVPRGRAPQEERFALATEPKLPCLDETEAPPPPQSPSRSAFARLQDGYGFEAAFPWDALGVQPRKGLLLGLQLRVRDLDPNEDCQCLTWKPLTGSPTDQQLAAAHLRISTKASDPCGICLWESHSPDGARILTVQAPIHHANDSVAIRHQGKTLAQATFNEIPGGLLAQAELALPQADALDDATLEIAVANEPPLRYRLRSANP